MLQRSFRHYLGTSFGFLRLLVHLKHDHSFEKITAALLLYLKLLGLLGLQLNRLQFVKPAGKCVSDTCVCEKGYTTGPACELLNRAGVCLCCCAFMCLCVCLWVSASVCFCVCVCAWLSVSVWAYTCVLVTLRINSIPGSIIQGPLHHIFSVK